MTIRQLDLRVAATRPVVETARSINEAAIAGRKTAFLCHSHLDQALVKGFVNYARDKGWNLYIDWQDTSLPSQPNRTTALAIKNRIVASHLFIFLATANSVSSRWCPWEIGYADGKKPLDRIVVAPTTDDGGKYYGNEYLQLYRRLDVAPDGRLAAYDPGQTRGVYASTL